MENIFHTKDISSDSFLVTGGAGFIGAHVVNELISMDHKVVVLDEPTSALTEKEVTHLFQIIRALKAEGKGIIYITHKMDEVFRIAREAFAELDAAKKV